MRDDERAVSELIGFVLVFSLVLGTVSVVYIAGLQGLHDTRDAERLQNAERAFDVLANNFQELGRGEAPNRATEIRLADSQLMMEERYRSRFRVNENNVSEAAPRPIVFDGGTGVRIVYEQGAVIRNDVGGGARMLRTPDYLFGSQRTVVRYIEPRGGEQSVGGTTTALVRGQRTSPFLVYGQNVSGVDVEFDLETTAARAPAWMRYFDTQESLNGCTMSPSDAEGETLVTITCSVDTNELYVSRVLVDVQIST
ncbi:hypothetical protein HWV23_05100 [Natronomonas halophila]|uniref:DUF7289 family protein n=1 Tax=Natronomonas halophila TaxID=2747817 RepID=UPI0015B77431|nr:hypothetical protein [Natronomonas halophila]QLD85123.1 hypothetical protein HWV23_05100 [Natronomonas halophila]